MNNGLNAVKEEIKKVLRGKDDVIEMVLCTLLASGHILLEDIPGVGKTTLAVALSRSLGIGYKRMQFTPDVLPSDILGFSMYDREKNDFTFKPGAAEGAVKAKPHSCLRRPRYCVRWTVGV